MSSSILRWYRSPAFTEHKSKEILAKLKEINNLVIDLQTEICYYVEVNDELNENQERLLEWILGDPFHPVKLSKQSQLCENNKSIIIECGPRFNFSTPFSSNAVSICNTLNVNAVRLEMSKRYLIIFDNLVNVKEVEVELAFILYDRMTECQYTAENIPKQSFNKSIVKPKNLFNVDVMKKGKRALEEINLAMGLAFDDTDMEYYANLFKYYFKRNPTHVECFDLAQSNSEHSRHWFFRGIIQINDVKMQLMNMICDTQKHSNNNNVIKFCDNSSAIKGFEHTSILPSEAGNASELIIKKINSCLTFTAETHNFPTGVSPFSGATTGTGGRIRDVQAVGRGGNCIAGSAGYSVGNLRIPEYDFPWEDKTYEYPINFASPLDILIQASNGASDYGNKFGEPLICGFVRSYGLNVNGERREWVKPIMFSGGVGSMLSSLTTKNTPVNSMKIVKIGGPVYRIGIGGGAASSIQIQGDNKAELDFNAVQRGDPEMEQKMNRVVRACIELEKDNPIASIHDQGAGGNGNVLKELVYPVGGIVYANQFSLGDPTINLLELWGAEYQESNALLCKETNIPVLQKICSREKCPVDIIGRVVDSAKIILAKDENSFEFSVDLELKEVLKGMPQKSFELQRITRDLFELQLPSGLTVEAALKRVLRLPSVASKRYLTNKVDRCVTGLIAQQQCVGPLHTPLADVAVTTIAHFGYEGIATAIGEQPIKGLVSDQAGGRMTVAESLTNLVFAVITERKDIKCSGNWMWAAKLPGEGAALCDTCVAICEIMADLGIAIDGGKDSLSMAARVGQETIKAPGTLVVSTYAPCPDVRKVVTPDLKAPINNKKGVILYVDLSNGLNRLGGSALAQCFMQLGITCPDVNDTAQLASAFDTIQELIKRDKILSGHDISDGGLITCLLEMAFAGMSGLDVHLNHKQGGPVDILFAEELGWILEVEEQNLQHVIDEFGHPDKKIPVYNIGYSAGFGLKSEISISINGEKVLEKTVLELMKLWEETSYRLEFYQTNGDCVESEFDSLSYRTVPKYELSFDPDVPRPLSNVDVVIAVLREEGTNGDREMAAAFLRVGFKVWDVTMKDLLTSAITLDRFRGLIFPGGFSYADVLGSAKGWAAGILFNSKVQEQFKRFLTRKDTFSLGVCNGCQLMALLGWIGYQYVETERDTPNILLEHNVSERFECRWSTVRVTKSKAVMFKGMEDSVMGIWIAHGEGRFTFKEEKVLQKLKEDECIGLQYTDDDGRPTEKYPMNPNGSVLGVAAVCSGDGRHLAMMPHPERCDQMYQWPWMPTSWQKYKKSPWERMFQNAHDWCCGTV